jgi:type IV pilus assembly protein PilE
MQQHKKLRGFTLLEMAVVLAISVILAGLSCLSYQHYLIRTGRLNAQIMLWQAVSRIEEYYNESHTYRGAVLNRLGIGANTQDNRYRLVLSHLTESTYRLSALPIGAQRRDKKCGELSINERNEYFSNGIQEKEACWKIY